jgi:hypothetical protein
MTIAKTHDEFVCRGCRRLIFSFPPDSPAVSQGLCGMCVSLPGWFDDPELRDILDPELEAAQAEARAWQEMQTAKRAKQAR